MAPHGGMIRQYELVERVKAYDPSVDEEALNRAYVYTVKAHGTQTRASGDPYFSHPVEVAGILSSMKLDSASIITGLLHDTVEDTGATIEEIETLFGPDIARLVDGVTKLSRIELQSDQSKQAENFRKLVLAMSEDIRVLLVKLADRLHNMRTLHFLKDPEKRKRIARETLEIYAPLAERIGINEWKDELEDLAFAELNPEIRQSIIARLDFLRDKSANLVQKIIDELKRTLAEAGIDAWVSGREKRAYSIWSKMQRKSVEFEQISDIVAFRVVVKTVEDCYKTLGAIHAAYRVVPGRFKDYISNPKSNGYRSLHTAVFGPQQGQRVEVQIRTADMHEIAELGVAAHWKYKQGEWKTEGRQYRWLRELLDILEHAAGPEEFLEHTKLEMFRDQVFCFSPKGEVFALPRGATPVDFAYAVHSAIGDSCVGAKINGRLVPLRTQLANGDQVEIVTSKAQTPNPTWERFVVTGRARARIRRFVRTQQRQQYLSLGRDIIDRAFRQAGESVTEKALEGVLKAFKCAAVEDLYVHVGEGHVGGQAVFNAVFPGHKEAKAKPPSPPKRTAKAGDKPNFAVPIRGLIPGMAVHYAGCCHPLPGDRIVGIVTTGKGVAIHTIDCESLEQFSEQPERWLDVAWEEESAGPRVGRIDVVIANEPGSLGNLTTSIGKYQGNITNLKITNRSQDFFEILVDIEVRDVKHLTNIIAALRASPGINSVERARG